MYKALKINLQKDFILPMRNWNNFSSICLCFCSQRFYLTYEELKHNYVVIHEDGSYGFYLTYEELKHCKTFVDPLSIKDFILPMRNWNNKMDLKAFATLRRFYLTYEELKPQSSKGSPYSSLPILSYLWGIETYLIYTGTQNVP